MRQIFLILILCITPAFVACSSGTHDGASNTAAVESSNAGAGTVSNQAAKTSNRTDDVALGGEQGPSSDVVRASAGDIEIRAGGSAEAIVRLNIADGYHVNANPPSNKFLIGTQLDVAPAEGIAPGKPLYPASLNKKFKFDPKPLAVYEGTVDIKLPVRASDTVAKGKHVLTARVRVQPCNDEACFPPRTVETSIPLTVN